MEGVTKMGSFNVLFAGGRGTLSSEYWSLIKAL